VADDNFTSSPGAGSTVGGLQLTPGPLTLSIVTVIGPVRLAAVTVMGSAEPTMAEPS
jgi:hypothetical protein